MADYSISYELEVISKNFEKQLKGAMKTLDDFAKKADEVNQSASKNIDDKPISNFGDKVSRLGAKISNGAKGWGLNLDQFYNKGSGIFKNFGIDIDKFASKFGVSGKLMTAIATCIAMLVKLGKQMDEASSEIAKGTGAIGENLTQLQFTAENAMVNGVGRSAKEVGKMVADLNTLFDVQGKDLENLTDQFDMFAEVTGQDTSTAIKGVSDLMHKWNIDTEDAPKVLDQLTKAGQMSGISVAELTSELTQNQATLSELGYNTTQSIALLSSFSKEGINSSNVLTGMKTAMATFAQAGLNGREELAKVVTQIQEASTSTEALSIATETFGARNGAEIVKAFREGGTYAQEYAEALKNAGLALEQTEEASRTSKDAMNELKSALTGTFGEFGQGFTELFKGILDAISNFVRMIQPIIQPIGNIFKTVFQFIGNVISWFTAQVKDYMTQNNQTFLLISSVLKGVADFFRKAFDNMFGIFKNVFGAIFSILKGDWKSAWINVKLVAMRVAKAVLDVISQVANGVVFLINKFIQGINKIKENWNKVAEFFGWDTLNMSSELISKDLAEDTGLNALIDKAEKELLAIKGQKEEIGELGSVPLADLDAQQKQIEQTADLQVSAFNGAQEQIYADSTTWQTKRLQQQLKQIDEEKKLAIKSAQEKGATQEELNAIVQEYADKQIAIYDEIQKIQIAHDEESVAKYANAEEEKTRITEYYATERENYLKEINAELTANVKEESEEQTEEVVSAWDKIAGKLSTVFTKVGSAIKTTFGKITKFVKSAWSKLFSFMQIDTDDVLDNVLNFADTILTFFTETLPKLPSLVDSITQTIMVLVETLTQPNVLKSIIEIVSKIIITVIKAITQNIGVFLKAIGELIGAILSAIGQAFSEVDWLEVLANMITGLWDAIVAIGKGLWDGITSIFTKLGEWISSWWNNIWKTVGGWFSNIGNNIGNWWKGLWGYATGTNNATSGLHLVGEAGPELIDFRGGERVYNARNTEKILSNAGSGGNSFNVTFNNMQDTTAYAMMKQLKQYQTQLAINGVL